MALNWVFLATLKGSKGDKGDVGTWYQRSLTTSDNLDTIANGAYGVTSGSVATALGLPNRLGSFESLPFGPGKTQRFVANSTTSLPLEVWERSSHGDGSWPVPQFVRTYPPVVPTRRAVVALNHPRGSDTDNRPLVHVRIPVKFAADVPDIRPIFRNYDYNSNTPYPGVLKFAGIAFGKHQINEDGGMTGLFPDGEPPQILSYGFDSPADASTFSPGWATVNAKAGEEYLLSYAFEAASTGQVNAYQLGVCFTSLILSAWVRDGATTATRQSYSPLSVGLEVRVDAKTPVYMYVGDSLTAGLNAAAPCRDSWAQKHAAAHGAIAQVLAQPGGSLADYADPMSPKLRMWAHLDKPDRVYEALGFNDVGNGATLGTAMDRFTLAMKNIQLYYGNELYYCTLLPHGSSTGFDNVRLPFNDWKMSLPSNGQMCFDHYAAIVNPATGLTDPRWAASPGDSHLKAGGYARMAAVTS